MILTRQKLAGMLGMIRATLDDELDCDGCFEQLDRFAEMKLAGKSAEQALPLVQAHLETCPCCRAEFAMLLQSLRVLR